MIILGLTGSIAMGKSETAKLFAAEGVPVFDADAEVHRLYQKDGAAARAVAVRWPEVMADGSVDRAKLSALIVREPHILADIEAIVHPLVQSARGDFLAQCEAAGATIVLLDIPLLYETGRQREVDKVVVVSTPERMQRQRAMARAGMTGEKLDRILRRQLPDAEKRSRADFVVDTSQGLDHARHQVRAILTTLARPQGSETHA